MSEKLTLYWIDDEFRKIHTGEESTLVTMVTEATADHTLVPFPTSLELIHALKKTLKDEAPFPDVIYFDLMLGEGLAKKLRVNENVPENTPDGIVLAHYIRQFFADNNIIRPPFIGCSVEPFSEQWGRVRDTFEGYICKDDKLSTHFVAPSYGAAISNYKKNVALRSKAERRTVEIEVIKNRAV